MSLGDVAQRRAAQIVDQDKTAALLGCRADVDVIPDRVSVLEYGQVLENLLGRPGAIEHPAARPLADPELEGRAVHRLELPRYCVRRSVGCSQPISFSICLCSFSVMVL
jgi:hypothetical protein